VHRQGVHIVGIGFQRVPAGLIAGPQLGFGEVQHLRVALRDHRTHGLIVHVLRGAFAPVAAAHQASIGAEVTRAEVHHLAFEAHFPEPAQLPVLELEATHGHGAIARDVSRPVAHCFEGGR
jgi:hypothetical protein